MDEHTFMLLYKAMVRSHTEFPNFVWCPFKLGDIKEIKKIQNTATKLTTTVYNNNDRLTAFDPGQPG